MKKVGKHLVKVENFIVLFFILLLALIPFLEFLLKTVGNFLKSFKLIPTSLFLGIPEASEYTRHIVLVLALLGGLIASRERQHITLINLTSKLPQKLRWLFSGMSAHLTVVVTTVYAFASLSMIYTGFTAYEKVGLFSIRIFLSLMPIAFLGMGIREITFLKERRSRIISLAGFLTGLLLSTQSIAALAELAMPLPSLIYEFLDGQVELYSKVVWVFTLLLVGLSPFGVPIFTVLGGVGYIFFIANWNIPSALAIESYTLLTSYFMPAIPLLTLAGFILSESRASKRLVDVFKAFFGWLPGGIGVATIFVCAFFTTFTGASGVTILALGGFLSVALREKGHFSKSFSSGLITASGSIGLLFPPSLPLIMFAVLAEVNLITMFKAGLIPGLVMVLALSVIVIYTALKGNIKRELFDKREALTAFKGSWAEFLLPFFVIILFLSGLANIVEVSSIAVVYILIISLFFRKDLKVKELLNISKQCIPIIGGIFVILTMAKGFSYFLVDAQIPMKLTDLVVTHIESKYIFLILLNLLLLLTGAFMDIYSAIIVVAPLILPIGEAYGISRIHLGVIFLANLELGYMTPPVGLNLFLSSYRFNTPLWKIYKSVIPFFLILLFSVLVITYVPWFSSILTG